MTGAGAVNTTKPIAQSAETLAKIEEGWKSSSDPESFYFEGFAEPKMLRRSKRFNGALSLLTFGGYNNFHGSWVPNEKVIWLDMIVSDRAGDGRLLLEALRTVTSRYGISLVGKLWPLKPLDWDVARPWKSDPTVLAQWYLRQHFSVLQDGTGASVVYHRGMGARVDVDFSFS